jgi:hypothetical protein
MSFSFNFQVNEDEELIDDSKIEENISDQNATKVLHSS